MTDLALPLLSKGGRRIAEDFGLSVALKIAERWGGRYLCVPKKVGPAHDLWQVLGPDAVRFCRHYGGETLYPAMEEAYSQAVKVAEMRALRKLSPPVPLAEISRRYGLTIRQITRLLGPCDGYRQDTLPGFDLDASPNDGSA